MNLKNGVGGADGKELSSGQLVFAGSVAGIANSVVSGPVEHIRIRSYSLLMFSCLEHFRLTWLLLPCRPASPINRDESIQRTG